MCVAVNFRKIYEKKTKKKSKEVILFCLKYKYFSKLVSYCIFLRCVICDFVDSCSENKPYGESCLPNFDFFKGVTKRVSFCLTVKSLKKCKCYKNWSDQLVDTHFSTEFSYNSLFWVISEVNTSNFSFFILNYRLLSIKKINEKIVFFSCCVSSTKSFHWKTNCYFFNSFFLCAMKGSERKSRTFLDVGQEVETNDFF